MSARAAASLTQRLRFSGARRGLAANFGGSLAIQATGVLTGTLLARGLGPHGRGIIAAMILWPALVVSIGDCGIGTALAYFSAQEPGASRAYVNFAQRAAGLVSIALMPAGLLVAYLGLAQSGIGSIRLGLALAAVFIPAAVISRYVGGVAQGLVRFGVFYSIRLSMSLLIAVILTLELIIHGMTLTGAVVAYAAGLSGMILVTLRARRRLAAGDRGMKAPAVRVIASYGLRSLFGSLYPVETLFVDQMIVSLSLGPRSLGLYTAALAFTTLPRVLATAVATAAFPHIAQAADPLRRTAGFLAIGAAALLPTGLGLTFLMPWLVPLIFGTRFSPAILPGQLLIWSSILFGFRQIAGDAIRGLGIPGRASVVEVATWPLMVMALVIATRHGLAAIAGAVVCVQALALGASFAVLGRAVRRRRPADTVSGLGGE